MTEMKKRTAPKKGKSKKELKHLEVRKGENGGHVVTHHFHHDSMADNYGPPGGGYHDPEDHAFGPNQGHEMLAHVAEHMGVPSPEPGGAGSEEEAGEPQGEEEA